MYKLRINASRKSDRDACWDDAAVWWKNYHDWYELTETDPGVDKYDYITCTYGGRYLTMPEWIVAFNNEEDATAFVLRYS